MAVMTVPRLLREKLGEDGIDSLVELLNKSEEKIKADVITLSGEKYERRLSEETANMRIDMGLHKSDLKGAMAELRVGLKESEERYERRLSEETGKLRVDMAELKSELKGDIAALKVELNGNMAGLRAELKGDMTGLRTEMAKSYASIIKWMFIFWLGQIGAILGILFAFFKH